MFHAINLHKIKNKQYYITLCTRGIDNLNARWEEEQKEFESKSFLYRLFHETPKPKKPDCISNIRWYNVAIWKLEDIRDNIERSHDTVYLTDDEYNSIMTYGGVTNN